MVSERKLNSARYKNAIKKTQSRCAYCGEYLAPEDLWSIDHVVPVFWGGESTEENMVMSCIPCNSMKNSRDAEDWKLHLLDKIYDEVVGLELVCSKYDTFLKNNHSKKLLVSIIELLKNDLYDGLEIEFYIDKSHH